MREHEKGLRRFNVSGSFCVCRMYRKKYKDRARTIAIIIDFLFNNSIIISLSKKREI